MVLCLNSQSDLVMNWVWREFAILVLTKRKAGSGDEIDFIAGRYRLTAQCLVKSTVDCLRLSFGLEALHSRGKTLRD